MCERYKVKGESRTYHGIACTESGSFVIVYTGGGNGELRQRQGRVEDGES